MSETNNVVMTKDDKKIAVDMEFKNQLAKEEKKARFIKDVDKLLEKYHFSKDYLYLAAKKSSLNKDRMLFTVEVETLKMGDYDGNVSILAHGTREEVEKLQESLKKKLEDQYADDKDIEFGDSYVSEVELPLMLGDF